MIVVASNWAIGDGTLVPTAAASLGALAARMHRAAIRAGVGSDGRHRPIDRLDIVLAGDTFDWHVSAEWLGDAKPWHASARSRELLATVARRSIRLGRAILGPLLGWVRRGLPLPSGMAAAGRGRTVSVPVRVTLLSGDRDAAAERVLAGRATFTVGRRWDDGRVSIRHGHERDPACRERRGCGTVAVDRPPTLAESVAVDLVARFAALVAARKAPAGGALRRIADAGVVGIPEALGGWLDALAGGPDVGAVRDAWERSVEAWWRGARRCVPTCETEFDVVDALARWLASAVRPDAERCPVAAGLGALVAAPAAGGPGAVEGHLRGSGAHAAVGLAPCRGVAPLAVCTNERGWPRWSVLGVDDEAGPIVAIGPRRPTGPGTWRVVDAA
ncbi:MAG: hypothetical protein ACKO40_02505 [Planctomycetaceae bacterium]